jgi:hypothetical protein
MRSNRVHHPGIREVSRCIDLPVSITWPGPSIFLAISIGPVKNKDKGTMAEIVSKHQNRNFFSISEC